MKLLYKQNVKIYIKIYNKCSYMFRFNQTIIREPTVCASLKLQYCCQLKYFVIELFGRVVAYYAATRPNCLITQYIN